MAPRQGRDRVRGPGQADYSAATAYASGSFVCVTATTCGGSVGSGTVRGVRINGGSQPVAASNCSAASANLSAVAWVRDLRSHGSLTALTVRATQWANKAMRLS